MDIPINKDIRKYKIKDIGNFSIKEALWLFFSGLCAYGVFFLLKSTKSTFTEADWAWVIIASIPGILFGFCNVFGLPLRIFLKTVIKEIITFPKTLSFYTKGDK